MTTIPSRLSRMTRSSVSIQDAHARARTLYRDWYKSAPTIVDLYELPIPVYDVRVKIRELFERNKHVTDLNVYDIMLLKGRQEYQETMNVWKQAPHIHAYFRKQEAAPQPETFMEKFLAGRDERQETTYQ